jgi:hypothetical protein
MNDPTWRDPTSPEPSSEPAPAPFAALDPGRATPMNPAAPAPAGAGTPPAPPAPPPPGTVAGPPVSPAVQRASGTDVPIPVDPYALAGPYPPPAYGGGYGGYGVPEQAAYAAYPVPKTNGMAIASMVVSIVGIALLVCYGIGGLPGLVGAILGHVAKRQIRDRQESGDGMALAGIIVGWIAFGLAVLFVGVIAALFISIANSTPTTDFDSEFDGSGFDAIGLLLG